MKTINEHILNTRPYRFGIVGEFQSGKSLLINCLLRRSIATVGHGNATTHTIVNYQYAEREYAEYTSDDGKLNTIAIEQIHEIDTRCDIAVINVYLKNDFLQKYVLTDIPGFGANEDDTWAAKKVLPEVDFVILVASSDTAMGASRSSFRDFYELQKHNVPYYLILNCTNTSRWRCDDPINVNVAETNLNLLGLYKPINYPLEENGINIVNFMWYWYSICNDDDELINRQYNKSSFDDYGISIHVKKAVGEASNFKLINKIFDMENRAFLELKREIKEEIDRLKKEICPVGAIQAFAYNTIPDGWLLCDGSPLQTSEYPDLFRVIGFTFGGDKKESFLLPDLRGRFVRGWDSTGKNDEMRDFGTKQEDALQEHQHKTDKQSTQYSGSHHHSVRYSSYKGAGSWGTECCIWEVSNSSSNTHESGTKAAGSHTHTIPELITNDIISTKKNTVRLSDETRPKNIAMLYCIKCR